MSYPRWPQSAFFYRPRTVPTSSPYGDYVPGFGSFGPHIATGKYGSLSPKYDWATPRYIRAEPSALDGFGYFGLDSYEQGCLADVRKFAGDALYDVLRAVTGGVSDSKVGVFGATFDLGQFIRGQITAALNDLENAMLDRTLKNWPEVRQNIVDFVMGALPNMKIPSQDNFLVDQAVNGVNQMLDPGVIGKAFTDMLENKLRECAQQQGVLPTAMPPAPVTTTGAIVPATQLALTTVKGQTLLQRIAAAKKAPVLTTRTVAGKTLLQRRAAAMSPAVPIAIAAAAILLLTRK